MTGGSTAEPTLISFRAKASHRCEMDAVIWFIKADMVKRPLRSVLITIMAIIGVVVFLVMLSISNAGFQILESYLKLFKPNMIVLMGPALPITPLKVASIPQVERVITLVITDAYVECDKNYTYVMVIGYYNFTQLAEIVQIRMIKGNTSGVVVPPTLARFYKRNCSLILPFLLWKVFLFFGPEVYSEILQGLLLC